MSEQIQNTAVAEKPIELLLLNTRQVAEALGISERTVFHLIASGELPSVRVRGCRRVFSDDLKAFAKIGTTEQ